MSMCSERMKRVLVLRVMVSASMLVVSLLFSGCVVSHAEMSGVVSGGEPVLVRPRIQPVTVPPVPGNYPTAARPLVSSKAAIVMDAASREVLYGKNIHEKRAVASTQKLLTAIVALERSNGAQFTVPVEATRLEPSKLYLKAGAVYPMNVLLKSLLVKSANDVAYTIAHGAGGSFESFISLMNGKAAQLGMRNSHFMNASGLTLTGQHSTAYDMALCASVAYQHPYIRECVQTKEMTFSHIDGRVKELRNTNYLLRKVPYCTGMKTGTTRASGYCLISSGELHGRTVIVGVFGAGSRPILWKESEALLRWSLERN